MQGTTSPRDRLPVIDAHLHFWDPDLLDYPWLRGEPDLSRRFGPEDLWTGGLEVDGFVFVQAECRADQAAAEIEWVRSLVDDGAPVLGVVAHVALETGHACEARLASYEEDPLVVGVRRLIQDEPPGFALQPTFVDATRILSDHGLGLDLCVRHHQLAEAARLVELCPEVTFVLDHLGKPQVGQEVEQWARDLTRLADLPNVHCKLSGLATEAGPTDRTAARLRPFIDLALRAFGPDRCLFGSDWPVSSAAVDYRTWYDVVLGACEALPPPRRADVFGANARAVYGLAAEEGK